jgi:hypothetical protein
MSKKGQDSYWICFVGHDEDFEAGRASLHYVEDPRGEWCLLLFPTRKKAERFVQANFDTPESHISMLEGTPESHLSPLTAGRFMVAQVPNEEIVELALEAGIDYLVRDPRPGTEQEVLRLDKYS